MRNPPSTPASPANALIRPALFVAIALASITSTPAFAEARAFAYIADERNPGTTPDPVYGPVTAVQTGGAVGGSHFASGSADAAKGLLRATSQAGLDGPYLLTANAAASISETITFSGGFGGTAYLDWSFDGEITLSNSPYNGQFGAAFGQFQVSFSTVYGGYTEYQTLSAFDRNCGYGTNCVVGTSTSRKGTVAIPINEYGANIGASLSTFASYGNLADFGNTSKLYLRLPDGVTFTSTSGQFLSKAEPIFTTAVPEPQTYAMLLGGLALIGAVTRRRQAG